MRHLGLTVLTLALALGTVGGDAVPRLIENRESSPAAVSASGERVDSPHGDETHVPPVAAPADPLPLLFSKSEHERPSYRPGGHSADRPAAAGPAVHGSSRAFDRLSGTALSSVPLHRPLRI